MLTRLLLVLTLFLVLSAAFAETSNPLPPNGELKLFVLAGQSNMAGVGGYVHPRHQKPAPDSFILNRSMLLLRENKTKPEPMPEPLFEVFGTDKKHLAERGVGPEWGFVTTLLKHEPEMRIGIVKIPASGSNIERWINDSSLPRGGGDYYDHVVETVREAMKHGTLAGFIWHQGESNSGSTDYDQLFERMVEGYRTAFDAPDLPVMAGTILEDGSNRHPVNQGLAKAAERVENVRVVSSVRTLSDNVHYDTGSQDEMGRRFAYAYLAEIGKPQKLRLTTTSLPEGVSGACYTAEIFAEGGDGSFRSWTCEGLPEGMSLQAGVLRGELPTEAAAIPLNITVTDSSGSDAQTLSLPVLDLPARELELAPCETLTLSHKNAVRNATETLVSPDAEHSDYHRTYLSFRIPPAYHGARIEALRLPVVMSGGPFPVHLSVAVLTDPALAVESFDRSSASKPWKKFLLSSRQVRQFSSAHPQRTIPRRPLLKLPLRPIIKLSLLSGIRPERAVSSKISLSRNVPKPFSSPRIYDSPRPRTGSLSSTPTAFSTADRPTSSPAPRLLSRVRSPSGSAERPRNSGMRSPAAALNPESRPRIPPRPPSISPSLPINPFSLSFPTNPLRTSHLRSRRPA